MAAVAEGFITIQTEDSASVNYGISANGLASSMSVTAKGQNEEGNGVNVYSSGKLSHAVYAQNGTTDITAENGGISVVADGAEATDAILSGTSFDGTDSHVKMTANGNIFLSAYNDSDVYANTSYAAGIFANSYGPAVETTLSGQDITIKAKSESNAAYAVYGYASGDGASNDVNISGNNVSIEASGHQSYSYGIYSGNSDIDIKAKGSTSVTSSTYGIYSANNSRLSLTAAESVLHIAQIVAKSTLL